MLVKENMLFDESAYISDLHGKSGSLYNEMIISLSLG